MKILGLIGAILVALTFLTVAQTTAKVESVYSWDYNFSINLPDHPPNACNGNGPTWDVNRLVNMSDDGLNDPNEIAMAYGQKTSDAITKMWNDGWTGWGLPMAFAIHDGGCYGVYPEDIGICELKVPSTEQHLENSVVLDHAICFTDMRLMKFYLGDYDRKKYGSLLAITNSTLDGRPARLFEVRPECEAIAVNLNATEIAVIEVVGGQHGSLLAQDFFNNTTINSIIVT